MKTLVSSLGLALTLVGCAQVQDFGGGSSKVAPPVARKLAVGGDFACAESVPGGALACWGSNRVGELGTGTEDEDPHAKPEMTLGVSGVSSLIAGGFGDAWALLPDGSAACWGYNHDMVLGDTDATAAVSTPRKVPQFKGLTAVATSHHKVCALDSSGSVSCWGYNFDDFGDPNLAYGEHVLPVPIPGVSQAVSIATGHDHGCAVFGDGSVSCWGSNGVGQTGVLPDGLQHSPAVVPGLAGVVSLATPNAETSLMTYARLSDGSVRVWGDTHFQLAASGAGVQAVAGLDHVKQLAIGAAHGCALIEGGTVRCWGNNEMGQLGRGTVAPDSNPNHLLPDDPGYTPPVLEAPLEVAGLTDVVAISAGDATTCVAHASGDISCWGRNQFGQVGSGSMDSVVPAPAKVVF